MFNKCHLNSINSLQTKSINQFLVKHERPLHRHTIDTTDDHIPDQLYALNVHLRQSIVDYITEEKLKVCPKLIQRLISGGLVSLDLWRLCQSNSFTTTEIISVLETMTKNSHCFESLSLGGSEWIYNNCVIKGPLKRLLETKHKHLVSLRLQSIAGAEDLLSVFRSCTRLKRLEICLPSVTDRDIDRIEERLKSCESVPYLRELLLPSSFKCKAIMKLLAIFEGIKTLKCHSFEGFCDLIQNILNSSENKSELEMAFKAKERLYSLTSLTVTHPMGWDSINRLVSLCPNLQKLSLELQSGMDLSAILRLRALQQLELRNSPSTPIDYTTQVLPILESTGKQLEVLSLEHFDVIDLTSCAKLCPNLLRFSAQWFTLLGYIRPDTPSSLRDRQLKNPFSSLTHIRLRPRSQRNIPSDAFAFVLSGAKRVTHIELYCCYDLSDSDIQALQTKNPLTHLKSIILRHGHKVTKQGLNQLVSKAHELAFIDCEIPLIKDESAPDP